MNESTLGVVYWVVLRSRSPELKKRLGWLRGPASMRRTRHVEPYPVM